MTKYINKLTGAELDYDKVHEDFERSLTWDHETDPEEFLMEAYEFEYEDWLVNQGIEEITVPDPVKPKKKTAKRKSSKKQIKTLQIPAQAYEAYRARDYRNNNYKLLEMNPPSVTEACIAAYGSEEGYRYFVEHCDIPPIDNPRAHYACFLVEYKVSSTPDKMEYLRLARIISSLAKWLHTKKVTVSRLPDLMAVCKSKLMKAA